MKAPSTTRPAAAAAAPRRSSAFVLGVVVALAILLGLLVPTESDRAPRPTDAALFPGAFGESSPLGDRVFTTEDGTPRYAFGRWKQPIEKLRFHIDDDWKLRVLSHFRTKFWHYTSINTAEYFIGAAVVKLGYAGDAFVYVVDKTTGEHEKFEFTGRLPGSLGLTFAASSIDSESCTSFTAPSGEFVSFCYESASHEWRIQANVTTVGANHGKRRPFIADMRLKQEEALTLLYPVGNDTLRPAYVHKGAGSPVLGSFEFGAKKIQLGDVGALGAIDWTRSLALRCTRWYWASSSFTAKVTTTVNGQPAVVDERASVGINLSKHVYDINGESQENAVWVNGKVFVLRGVEFNVPKVFPLTEKWLVASSHSDQQSVKLRFTPSGGSREDHTRLIIFESDFVQPYGIFDGEISFTSADGKTRTVIEVEGAFGVVEDHFALW